MAKSPPPFGLKGSLAFFGGFAFLLFIVTHDLIPRFSVLSGMECAFWWFVLGGVGVFFPFIVFSYAVLNREGAFRRPGLWTERLRFKKLTKQDWYWTVGALVVIGALSGLISLVAKAIYPPFSTHASFMEMDSIGPGRYWLLLVWLPYWFFNIMGEEIFWRGVLLPRQQVVFGKNTWLVQAAGWGLFHFAFGWQIMLTLLPILFILPYVVFRRKNSWIGVIIHAGLNGPSFLLVAFGVI